MRRDARTVSGRGGTPRRLLVPRDGGYDLTALLELHGVEVAFPAGRGGFVHAVNGVDLTLDAGETVGIVGESGCGKSSLGQAVMGLVPLSAGDISFEGATLGPVRRRPPALRQRLQMVFQDPQSSLDPRLAVWRLIAEPLIVADLVARADLRGRVLQLAAEVGLRPDQLDRFAHEFSGGQRQRIAIARALALQPALLVLDEPTSALDVSVQAQIVNLLMALQRDHGLAYLLISHDVALIRHVADRVAVMYLGQVMEVGRTAQVLGTALHPYTQMLLAAVPSLDHPLPPPRAFARAELPSNRVLPSGCFFRERCPIAAPGCEKPQRLAKQADGRSVRCWRAAEGQGSDSGSSTRGQ